MKTNDQPLGGTIRLVDEWVQQLKDVTLEQGKRGRDRGRGVGEGWWGWRAYILRLDE